MTPALQNRLARVSLNKSSMLLRVKKSRVTPARTPSREVCCDSLSVKAFLASSANSFAELAREYWATASRNTEWSAYTLMLTGLPARAVHSISGSAASSGQKSEHAAAKGMRNEKPELRSFIAECRPVLWSCSISFGLLRRSASSGSQGAVPEADIQSTPELEAAVDEYQEYAAEQAGQLVEGTALFTDAVIAGDVEGVD